MRRAEEGLLMLTCALGENVTPLSASEYQRLMQRLDILPEKIESGEVSVSFLRELGYSPKIAQRIVDLLERDEALHRYLSQPELSVITRISDGFPTRLRRLGNHCPSALFCKGDPQLLRTRCICLVGARQLPERSRRFAQLIGTLAAQEGFTLVSGGANGADTLAQEACLAAGGSVICFVPDNLSRYPLRQNVLYCSDEGWEFAFSADRALRRNHYIHALGEKAFVAHCPRPKGGTWKGTSYNLQHNLSTVYILDESTEGALLLASMGAICVDEQIPSIDTLLPVQLSIFD